jgi:hypothetical protein
MDTGRGRLGTNRNRQGRQKRQDGRLGEDSVVNRQRPVPALSFLALIADLGVLGGSIRSTVHFNFSKLTTDDQRHEFF